MQERCARNDGLAPPEIIRRIKIALERDATHSWDDVQKMLADGRAQLFWNAHGAWITEIVSSPLARWLHVWIVAGELPGVMDLQEQVIEHARKNNCRNITATARFGWKHVAREHGWKDHAVMITHEVPSV